MFMQIKLETDFIQGLLKKNEKKLARSFNFTPREINKKITVIYFMDYSPLLNIRQLNEMGVADSLLGM
jgi:hypothetical protein